MLFHNQIFNKATAFIFAAASLASESTSDSNEKVTSNSYSSSSQEKYVDGKRVDFSNKDTNQAYSSQGTYKMVDGKKVYDDFKDQQFAQERKANPQGESDRSAYLANHPNEGTGFSGYYKDNGQDSKGPWDFSKVFGDYNK